MIRLFDIILSLIALFVLGPIFFFLFLVEFFNKHSIFFYQKRVGLNKKIFTIIKFRTMKLNTKSISTHLISSYNITALGLVLRRLKIDELPQLWNVLKGDMSLIGPRPLLVEYLSYYTLEQQRRHNVLPGITGWAQIHGRNLLQFNERFVLDVWYVDNISIQLDLFIFYKTIIKIFKSENVLMQDPNKITDLNKNSIY